MDKRVIAKYIFWIELDWMGLDWIRFDIITPTLAELPWESDPAFKEFFIDGYLVGMIES